MSRPQRPYLTASQIAARDTRKAALRRSALRMVLRMGMFAFVLVIAWALVILAYCLGGPH